MNSILKMLLKISISKGEFFGNFFVLNSKRATMAGIRKDPDTDSDCSFDEGDASDKLSSTTAVSQGIRKDPDTDSDCSFDFEDGDDEESTESESRTNNEGSKKEEEENPRGCELDNILPSFEYDGGLNPVLFSFGDQSSANLFKKFTENIKLQNFVHSPILKLQDNDGNVWTARISKMKEGEYAASPGIYISFIYSFGDKKEHKNFFRFNDFGKQWGIVNEEIDYSEEEVRLIEEMMDESVRVLE